MRRCSFNAFNSPNELVLPTSNESNILWLNNHISPCSLYALGPKSPAGTCRAAPSGHRSPLNCMLPAKSTLPSPRSGGISECLSTCVSCSFPCPTPHSAVFEKVDGADCSSRIMSLHQVLSRLCSLIAPVWRASSRTVLRLQSLHPSIGHKVGSKERSPRFSGIRCFRPCQPHICAFLCESRIS